MVAGPLPFARRADRRLLAGTAGGFADEHGIDPLVVRGALVMLSFAGGLGLVLYALGTVVSSPPAQPVPPAPPRDQLRNASVAAITAGILLVVRSTGLWLGDALMVPIVVIVCGFVVLGVVRPEVGTRPWEALNGSPLGEAVGGRRTAIRLGAGAALVALGLVLVGVAGGVSTSVRIGAFATALTVLGIAVLLGPWVARLLQDAARERRQRIRVQEREAMAAHLHDSVLQTLALIQRTADDPRRTVTLARQQERELRDWLYGTAGAGAESLGGAVRAMARDVETTYDVTVDVVLVGDRPLDDRMNALTAAVREACVNAAKHSGVGSMSVYLEVGPTGIDAFVRDRGSGFDTSATRAEGRGIAQSIVGRLERIGGTARIDSVPGAGTEVHLRIADVRVPG